MPNDLPASSTLLLEREASQTACIIDGKSVKSAEKGGGCVDPRGYDAGKKRHILVDTEGLLVHAIVHQADIQDRDGGKLFADGCYQVPIFAQGTGECLTPMLAEIVKRCDRAKGFVVLPRRWAELPKVPRAQHVERQWTVSSAPSHGLTGVAVSPRTSRTKSVTLSRS